MRNIRLLALLLILGLGGCSVHQRRVYPVLLSGYLGEGDSVATHLRTGCRILAIFEDADRYQKTIYFEHSERCKNP